MLAVIWNICAVIGIGAILVGVLFIGILVKFHFQDRKTWDKELTERRAEQARRIIKEQTK